MICEYKLRKTYLQYNETDWRKENKEKIENIWMREIMQEIMNQCVSWECKEIMCSSCHVAQLACIKVRQCLESWIVLCSSRSWIVLLINTQTINSREIICRVCLLFTEIIYRGLAWSILYVSSTTTVLLFHLEWFCLVCNMYSLSLDILGVQHEQDRRVQWGINNRRTGKGIVISSVI